MLLGKSDAVDLLLIAVKPEYQNKGVNALLFADLIPYYIKNGYKHAESNPELSRTPRCRTNGARSMPVSTAAAVHTVNPSET